MGEPSTEGYAPGWLEIEKGLGARPLLSGTTDELREQFAGLGAMLAGLSPPPDLTVKTRDTSGNGVPVRIYTPEGAEGKSLPVGVYYHGGGYVLGNLDSEDALCRYIAKHTPCIIVSTDYRLAPEHKIPAILEDSVSAFKWAFENASTIRGDQKQVFTIGASAGGGLALTVADQLIKGGLRKNVKAVIAMVPVTAHKDSIPKEYASGYTAYTENASGVPMIDAGTMKTFFEAADADPRDVKTFVSLSKNLKDFPPTYIATCGKDPLRDDGKILEAMLKKEGVKTKYNHYEGQPHYFWLMPGIPGGEEFLQDVVKGAQWALAL